MPRFRYETRRTLQTDRKPRVVRTPERNFSGVLGWVLVVFIAILLFFTLMGCSKPVYPKTRTLFTCEKYEWNMLVSLPFDLEAECVVIRERSQIKFKPGRWQTLKDTTYERTER